MKHALMLLLAAQGCAGTTDKPENPKKQPLENRTITTEVHIVANVKYVTYSSKGVVDSQIGYYQNGQKASINRYSSTDSIKSEYYYESGVLNELVFDEEKVKSNILQISFYPDRNILSRTYINDGIRKNGGDTSVCLKLNVNYYHNGVVRSKWCQGMYGGMGIPVGTWLEYDSSGAIKQTTYYHPDEYGKDYKIVTKYKNGKIKGMKIFNNDVQYENSLKELKHIPK